MSAKSKTTLYMAGLFAVWFFYSFTYLKLQDDYWFEDDTSHLGYVIDHPNPIRMFCDQQYILDFSYGRTLTPWIPFSFWIDHMSGPLLPSRWYIHQAFAALLCMWLMYFLLRPWSGPTPAFLAAAVWPFLPSTISILEFLSTRHYLEGLVFVLAAFIVGRQACREDGCRAQFHHALCAGLYFLAAINKEIYVTAGAWFLICIYHHHRRYRELLFPMGAFVIYFAYRLTMIGFVGSGFENTWQFLYKFYLFPSRLPFMFTGDQAGYMVAVLFIPAGLFLYVRYLKAAEKPLHAAAWSVIFAGGSLVALVGTVFPVLEHPVMQYQSLGTWYRILFLINTALLLGMFRVISKLDLKATGSALFIALLGALFVGSPKAVEGWDQRKAHHRADAEFYLANPDKLLYSDLPATWFLPGVHKVFSPEQEPHFITPDLPFSAAQERLEKHAELWVPDPTRKNYQSNNSLKQRISQNIEKKIYPLDAPIQETPTQNEP